MRVFRYLLVLERRQLHLANVSAPKGPSSVAKKGAKQINWRGNEYSDEGIVGYDGAPGADGRDGAPGNDGRDGIPGADGRSVFGVP